MIDRTTKFILAAIALGLWANFAAQMLRSAAADQIEHIRRHVQNAALAYQYRDRQVRQFENLLRLWRGRLDFAGKNPPAAPTMNG